MKLGWGGFSYDTTANKTVFAFGGNGSYFSDAYGFVFSMTCSGTTLTLNTSSTHVFASVNVNLATVSYDPVANKHIVYYQNGAVGTYHATSVTVSGNSFTSGTTITPTGFKVRLLIVSTYQYAAPPEVADTAITLSDAVSYTPTAYLASLVLYSKGLP